VHTSSIPGVIRKGLVAFYAADESQVLSKTRETGMSLRESYRGDGIAAQE